MFAVNQQRHLSSAEDYTNITICVVLDRSTVLFQKEKMGVGWGTYKKKSLVCKTLE